jgi:hypothetical protein
MLGHAGWGVAALDFAAAGLDGLDDALGFVGEAVGAAEVEDLGLAAEDGGDDPGFAGQAAGGAGADRLAGVEVGGFQLTHEGLQGHEDHDGGVEAAGLGELLGGVALDQLDEGLAEALGGGFALTQGSLAGEMPGCGQREQVLLEHGAGQGGVDGEPAVELAVPVVPHGQPGGGLGVALFLLQERGLVGQRLGNRVAASC